MTDYDVAAQPQGFSLHTVVGDEDGPPGELPTGLLHRRLGDDVPEVRHPLNLIDYVDLSSPAPPPAVHRSHLEHKFPMDGNDRLGDCGPVMVAHGIEAFHLDEKTPVPQMTEEDVIDWYSIIGGYEPGNPSSDGGVNNTTLIEKWQAGLKAAGLDHTIKASAYIDPHNVSLNERAIWEFVVLFRAAGLPISAQGQSKWEVTDPSLQGEAEPGSWGGHDIPYLSYDGKWYRCVTWEKGLLLSYDWDAAYALEGFVVVTDEMLGSRGGTSPAGFKWDQLIHDCEHL
jgi:hypothetical protein